MRFIDAVTAELEASNREITKLSRTDRLTQLVNRIQLDHVLEENLQQALRYATPFSIILLDLDHFKQVNDVHGHLVGDEVLVSTAKILTTNTRTCDTVGRWGGEEFLIVVPNANLSNAARLAEKLRGEIEAHDFPTAGKITASFGVTSCMPNDDVEKMVNRADIALYTAKHAGRNRVEWAKGCG
jgi:diguanylate cyclase (GGDEF)-like protein